MHKLPSGNYAHGISRKELGRRFSFSLRTKSYREAQRRAAAINSLADAKELELLERLACGNLHISEVVEAMAPGGPGLESLRRKPAFISLGDACEALLVELGHSPVNTQRAAKVTARQLLAGFHPWRTVSSITYKEALFWLRRPIWSRRTQVQKRFYCSRIWELANLMSSSPISNIWELVEIPGRDVPTSSEWLDLRETYAMLEKVKNPISAAFLACGFLGTMRIQEAANLQWKHVDFHAGTIEIEATTSWRPKTRRGIRTIQAPEPLLTMLQEIKPDSAVFGPYVFGGMKPLSERTATRRARRALSGAGYPNLTFHSGRHSAITNMLVAGASVPEVMEQAGLAAKTLLETYAHVLSSRRAKLGSLLHLTEKVTEEAST